MLIVYLLTLFNLHRIPCLYVMWHEENIQCTKMYIVHVHIIHSKHVCALQTSLSLLRSYITGSFTKTFMCRMYHAHDIITRAESYWPWVGSFKLQGLVTSVQVHLKRHVCAECITHMKLSQDPSPTGRRLGVSNYKDLLKICPCSFKRTLM